MQWEAWISFAGVAATFLSIYLGARGRTRADRRASIVQAAKDLDDAIEKAVSPWREKVTERDTTITQMRADHDRVIENATELWRERAHDLEQERNYWRSEARGDRGVNLVKPDQEMP